MHLFETGGVALVLAVMLSACASSGPRPGTLEFIKLQQQHELAQACYKSLSRSPWKRTYYMVPAIGLVDERVYCAIKAREAVVFRGR